MTITMHTAGSGNAHGRTVRSVLVVDSDPDTRALYKAVLAPLADTVAEAEDGAEALGKALGECPDLIVTRTSLRRLDGLSLCSLLRSDPATQSAKILVIASASSSDDRVRAMNAGADAVLVTPVRPDEVFVAARRLWERGMSVSSRGDASPSTDSMESEPALPSPRARIKSRSYQRQFTTTPPKAPPQLYCPGCDGKLAYVNSYIGGVSEKFPEQWDYFSCDRCGTYCYRHRTRKLAPVA
jgi:CheY-like chemotaxis protein